MSELVGIRLKALREAERLSQDQLAAVFGLKDRQSVSAIETGERRLTADELLLVMDTFNKPLEFFTDPFLLVGEGQFSWRQTATAAKHLEDFETKAGRAIAAFRKLAPEVGRKPSVLRSALRLTKQSKFEDAMAAGENFAAEYQLGDVPAARLAAIMESKLGILVLMVDAIKGISGAACRVNDLDAVLINRHEAPGRRNFDLAHELFHILTWEAMPPDRIEVASDGGSATKGKAKRSRTELLADNFASAVLMPKAVLERHGPWSGDLTKKINKAAHDLQVSAVALKWRLLVTNLISKDAADAISDSALRNNGRAITKASPPSMFSKAFMEVISLALAQGFVSQRRAAELLDVTVDEIGDLCTTYGLEAPDEL